MKYVNLKQKKREILQIQAPNKGMNLLKPTVHLEEGEIGFSKNVIFDGGILKTRNGINAQNVLDTSIVPGYEQYEYFSTDTKVLYKGEVKRIVVAGTLYADSHYYMLVYLVGSKGDVTSLGCMHFNRIDDNTFYIPKNVIFYQGECQSGGGFFAFVTTENFENEQMKSYSVFEIDDNWTMWERAYGYYTPVVYINGRGNSYEEARGDNQVSSLKPMALEAPNMLYNRFYAYYTSDGYSSAFRLPYTQIKNHAVTCKIYRSATEYTEWLVSPDNTSATQSFLGQSVTFHIDRNTGVFNFTSSAGNYSVPITTSYRENNIRIAASKEFNDSFNDVVSCTFCANIGSKIIFAGGKQNNRLYYTTYQNPLYFPMPQDNEIGSPDKKVTAVYEYNDGIYMFKENEIFSVKITGGKAVNSTALLADEGKIFNEKVDFKIDCINDSIGSVRKNTVSCINGRLIWQEKNGNVYTSISNGKTECLTNTIKPIFEKIKFDDTSVAVVLGEKYYLCCKNNVLVFDISQSMENCSKYYWEFPLELKICGIMNMNGGLLLLCSDKYKSVGYTALFTDSADNIIVNKTEQLKKKIPSFVKFKGYYLGDNSQKKNIYTVFLRLSLQGKTKIKIGQDSHFEEYTLRKNGFSFNGQDVIKLLPSLNGVDLVEITLDSEDNIAFSSAEIYFRKIGI